MIPYDDFDENDDQSCEIGFEGIYMTLNQKNKEKFESKCPSRHDC